MRLTANRHYIYADDDKQRQIQVRGDDVVYGTDPELTLDNKLGVLKEGKTLVIATGVYFSSLGDSDLVERDAAVDPEIAELKPDVKADEKAVPESFDLARAEDPKPPKKEPEKKEPAKAKAS